MSEKSVLSTGKYSGTVSSLLSNQGILIGTTTYSAGHFNNEFHYHANPHLSFILRGGNIESRKHLTVERKVGDMMFFHSGEIHRALPANSLTKNMNLELESDFLKRYSISENQVSNMIDDTIDSKFLILKMYSELLENDCFSEVSIQMLLFGEIAKTNQDERSKRPDWMPILTDLLTDEWNTFHCLEDLSTILNVHPVTISKYFSKYSGCTLGEYMRKIKIEKSLSHIQNDELSLTEIALECGFSDQSHFIRNFKKFTGQLPKSFKRM